MSKAAASDFIKQMTAAEAESQGAAAHSPCPPPPSCSPSPLETHTFSRKWSGAAAGAVLEVPETKNVLVEERECLKLYDIQHFFQVEHNENQSWSARKEKPSLPLTYQAWSEYWGFNNEVPHLSNPPLRTRKMDPMWTLFYKPPWMAEMMGMRMTTPYRAADRESQESAIHTPCWSHPSSSASSQMGAHAFSRQQVGPAAGPLLSATVAKAEALAKREKCWEDNRDHELSQEEDSTDKNWSTEEESPSVSLPHEAKEEHWDSQLHTPTSTKLDLPRWVYNRPSYDLDLLSGLDEDMDWEEEIFFSLEGHDMWDMRERIPSKESPFWKEVLVVCNRKSFEHILCMSAPTAVPTQQASLFRRALGALCKLFQCPCITRQPEL
ncbi:uncharacterized protein LOC135289806 [Passer domesticus]|uniref:uncharacterized protein LOC135289806 n=1 Tax=Passer domesticus TaxID=48849 RepID=UPI0030FF1DF2